MPFLHSDQCLVKIFPLLTIDVPSVMKVITICHLILYLYIKRQRKRIYHLGLQKMKFIEGVTGIKGPYNYVLYNVMYSSCLGVGSGSL